MGWDGFGLPAENYAIKTGISPRQAIDQNTTMFKKQLMQMGFGYDWSREIDSTNPEYYRWTQWFFLLLFKKGLAYQQESLQWWCPFDKTVLANEQVETGRCWRCGNEVIKKPLKQWFFKITDYADRLVEDLEDLDWSESIKSMQRNWIGKSQGAEVDFKVADSKEDIRVYTTRPDTLFGATFLVLAPEHPLVPKITAKDHLEQVQHYQAKSLQKSEIDRMDTDREKTGVFTGAYAVNPVNNKQIPIWIADYVLTGYGTGAIMAVPAHDERDHEFAKKFDIPINYVIAPERFDTLTPIRAGEPITERTVAASIVKHPTKDLYLILKKLGWETESYSFPMGGVEKNETTKEAAARELIEETGYTNFEDLQLAGGPFIGNFYHEYKKRNGHITTYAYFTTLKDLTKVEVSEEDKKINEPHWVTADKVIELLHGEGGKAIFKGYLGGQAVFLDEGTMINSGEYDGMPSAEAREKIVADLAKKKQGQHKVNYRIRDWLISRQRYWGAPIPIIHCPDHGAVAVPEDQLPVVLPEVKDYEPSGDGRSPLANVPEFVNTTCPTCGKPAKRETDTMDGFACSSWYFLRFADPRNTKEPFSRKQADFWLPVDTYIGGAEHAVMHLLYARFWTKVMYDEGLINFTEPFKALRNQGMILAPDGQKMSKSKGNVIAPSELIDQGYGADSVRIMELFIGPWNQSAAWSVEGIGGTFRFLQRVWTLTQEFMEAKAKSEKLNPNLAKVTHRTIKKVSQDLHEMGFNTAIAALMELTNELYKIKAQDSYKANNWQASIDSLLQLLAPFAPHITEELWHQLGHKDSIHTSEWPAWDEKYLVTDSMTIVVQVNGKVRAQLSVSSDGDEAVVTKAAQQDEKVKSYLEGKQIKKTIYVPGKLVSFVVG
jgi:leucyl-tRNA synthetase